MVDLHPHSDQQPPPRWWARIFGLGITLAAVGRVLLGGGAVAQRPTPAADPPEQGDGQSPDGLQNLSVRYEQSDANLHWILGIILGAVIFAVVVQYAVLRFFYDFREKEANLKQSNYPLAPTGATSLPPDPRLEQVNRMANAENGDVYRMEKRKAGILNSYGSSAEKGYVRIPIEQAIDFLTNKCPVREAQPTPQQERRQNGLVNGGESNSGRMFRGRRHD